MAKMLPVRFSHLRAYGRSAMHGYHARTTDGDEQTYSMERGTAVHALLFGNRQVCGYPGPTRRGKEYDAFVAAHPDTEILTLAEYSKARRMADAVLASKVAKPYLQGITEETLLFRWNGLECRATPDIRGEDFLTELKCSSTSDPERFPWQAIRMHYHAQMRMQCIACDTTFNRWPADCFIVCVEDSEPHPVTVFRITEQALDRGARLLMLWAERLKACESSNYYPGYAECVMPLDVAEDDTALEFNDEPVTEAADGNGLQAHV